MTTTENKTLTLDEFIAANNLRMVCEAAGSNPNMDDAEWSKTASHWLLTILRNNGRSMVVPYSQGPAHTEEPILEDVLQCLADDAASIENSRTFEEWAEELGFDTDSRKAERCYKACVRQTNDLRFLLGDAYETLLWEVEKG